MMRSDWYSADIIAALKKQGASLSDVPRNSGGRLLHWPKGEKLIAGKSGVVPKKVWSSH